jgi:hypothetical protein
MEFPVQLNICKIRVPASYLDTSGVTPPLYLCYLEEEESVTVFVSIKNCKVGKP